MALALSASGLATGSARAQAKYPDRPVRVILPFGAGGVADITARLVAEELGKKLGQNFVIENNPGAGGITAARAALSGDKDGYTLTLLTNGTAISVPLFNHLPFDPLKDFVPISTIGYFRDRVRRSTSSSPFHTLARFPEGATREKPGTINVGTDQCRQHAKSHRRTVQVDGERRMSSSCRSAATPDVVVALLRGDVQMDDRFLRAAQAQRSTAARRGPSPPAARRARWNCRTCRPCRRPASPVSKSTAWNGLYAPAGTPKADHRHAECGAARSAGRSGAEEARARSRHRRQGLHARGARRADARRHRQMGQRDRQRAHIPKQ